MQRIFVVVLEVVCLSGCNSECICDNRLCDQDAGIQLDSQVQQDAANNDAAREDASVQNDAELQQDAEPDSEVQQDAEIGPDADVTPAQVMYSVDSQNVFPVYQPWRDGIVNTFTEVTIVNGSKEVTINNLSFGLHGTANANDFMDMHLVQDGTVVATPTWVSPQKLSFPLSIVLMANDATTFELEGRPEWAICKDVSFDIDADTDIEITTNHNGVPANVAESATSLTPMTSPVEGVRIEVDASTPTGHLVTGVDLPLFIFNIYSTYDVQIRDMYYELTINPEMALSYIDMFGLWHQGMLVAGRTTAYGCDQNNVCMITPHNDFDVPGNCQQYQIAMTANIGTIQYPTALAIEAIEAQWQVLNMFTAMFYTPDQLPDRIWSSPLIGP